MTETPTLRLTGIDLGTATLMGTDMRDLHLIQVKITGVEPLTFEIVDHA